MKKIIIPNEPQEIKFNAKLSVYRKSTGKFEILFVTPQAVFIGITNFSYVPILPATLCAFKSQILTLKCGVCLEQLVIDKKEDGDRIYELIRNYQKKIAEADILQAINSLQEGCYFVTCAIMDAWSTNRSYYNIPNTTRSNMNISCNGNNTPMGSKEKKIVWVDPNHKFLYIGASKCKFKGSSKILLKEITEILFQPCSDHYKIIINCVASNKQNTLLLFTNDFVKLRQFIIALEACCIETPINTLKNKPHTSVKICFEKFIYILKLTKSKMQKDYARFFTYKEMFECLINQGENIVEDEEFNFETHNTCNDLCDTKRLPNQLVLQKNPQDLMYEKKNELLSKLSILSRLEENEEQSINNSEQQSEYAGTVCNTMDIMSKKENSVDFGITHTSGSTNCTKPKISEKQKIEPDPESIVNYASDRIDENSEKYESQKYKMTDKNQGIYQPHGKCSKTENDLNERIYIEEGGYSEIEILRAKLEKKKQKIMRQNLEMGNLVAKCDMQERKIYKLKHKKEALLERIQKETEKNTQIITAYAKTAKEAEINEKKAKNQVELLQKENKELKSKIRKIIDAFETNGRYLRRDKENIVENINNNKESVISRSLSKPKIRSRAMSPTVGFPGTSRSPMIGKNKGIMAVSPRGNIDDLIKDLITTLSNTK